MRTGTWTNWSTRPPDSADTERHVWQFKPRGLILRSPRQRQASAVYSLAHIWQCKGYVAPRSRPKLGWQNSQLLGDDIVASLKKLAQDGPELLVQGSSDLLQTLWKEGLVDELSVRIFPVVLGKGKRLFGNGARPAGLKLVKSQSFPTGVIVANYQPASEVKTGDFQLAEPTEAELERRRNLT